MLPWLLLLIASMNAYSLAIVGGSIDSTFGDATVHFRMGTSDSCVATKIKPHVLITAAHCVDDLDQQSIRVSTSKNKNKIVYSTIEIQDIIIHPSFAALTSTEASSYQASLNSSDVALIIVKPNTAFSLLKISPIDLEEVSVGDEVKFYGYGCKETFNQESPIVPERQFAHNTISGKDSLHSDHGAYSAFYASKAESIYRLNIVTFGKRFSSSYSSLCTGDSGGGLFKNGKLVGVNSNYTMNDIDVSTGESISGVAYLNLHTRLSSVKSWLKETLLENE